MKEQQNTLPCQVILLPAKDKTSLIKTKLGGLMYFKEQFLKDDCQHLYFISYSPIEGGDWCVNQQYHNLMQVKSKNQVANLEDINTFMLKVEATTDTSLGLPLIPQSYIEWYVDNYNKKQGNIKEVTIPLIPGTNQFYIDNFKIVLYKPKQSWSREEIIAFVKEKKYVIKQYPGGIVKYFEDNLK